MNSKKLVTKKNSLINLSSIKRFKLFEKYYNDVILTKYEQSNKIKHFIPFNKQWKNSAYYFDKNHLSMTSTKQHIVNNFIKNYFNIVPSARNKVTKSKRMRDYLRRSSVNNVFVSNSEIKQTSDKVYATVYVYDRRKYHYLKKVYFSNKNIINTMYTNNYSQVNNLKSNLSASLFFNKSNLRYLKTSNMHISKRKNNLLDKKINRLSVTKKSFHKRSNRFALRKRTILIRRKFLKQSKFNQVKFHNTGRNIINTFGKQFLVRFWIMFSKYLNISLTMSKNKLMLTWPVGYTIVNPDYYKLYLNNNFIEKLNSVNLNKFINNYLVNYKLFNVFNIMPARKTKKLVINTKMVSPLYINLLNKFDQLKIKNISSRLVITSHLFASKVKIVNFLITSLIKKLVVNNLVNLFGDRFTKVAILSIWKQKFNGFYTNVLKRRINKQLINMNNLIFNKDFLSIRNKVNVPIIKNILGHVYDKKVIFNIVNIRYLHLNSDSYMEAIKVKLNKRRSKLLGVIRKSLKLVKLPKISNPWYDSLDILSASQANMKSNQTNNIYYTSMDHNDQKYVSNKNFYSELINIVKYKFATGVRLEAKGRLTRRYTASRAVFKFKYKGNLKNLEFSKKYTDNIKITPNMYMIRGYTRPNIQYTFTSGIRRIGVFGLKGWISGN